MRYIIRLGVLALSAYGAWTLYEQYGDRVRATRGSLDDFAARAKRSASDAVDRVSSAASDATDAITSSAADINNAAVETEESVSASLRDERAVPATASS